jgi:hypothetical protein
MDSVPWRTWLLWRRMVLWQITSYRTALDLDVRIRRARRQLMVQYGNRWKQVAPAELVWMPETAPFAEQSCAQVEALIGRQQSSNAKDSTTDVEQQPRTDQARETTDESEEQLQQAMRINRQHWATRSRPVSADTLREQLHIGAARARELTAALRALDKATIQNTLANAPN